VTLPGRFKDGVGRASWRIPRFGWWRLASCRAGVLPAAAALTLLAVRPASGQTGVSTTRRAGALQLTPTFVISQLGVDTNVFNSVDDPRSDFTFTMGPELEVVLPQPRFEISARTGVDFVYYKTYGDERGVNFDGQARIDIPVGSRLRLFVEDRYLNTRDRPDLEVDVRSRRYQNEVGVGVRVAILPKIDVGIEGRTAVTEFRNDVEFEGQRLSETLDQEWRAVQASIAYRATPLTTFSVVAEARETAFPNAESRNSHQISITPGVTFSPGALISGRLRLGYRETQALDDRVRDDSGLYADVGLSYRLGEATEFDFSVTRELVYAYARAEPYYVAQGYALTVRRALVRSFDVTAGAHRRVLDYSRLASADDGSPPRETTVRGLSGGIGYIMNRQTRVGVQVNYQERLSNQPGAPVYNGLRAGLTMTRDF
jgi:hypothetical protein